MSGVLGFCVGAIGFSDWQVAVETSQVLAGIVTYPPDNPFYIYHLKLWTILHHVSALWLLAGVSEAALSIAISGLLGMLSFQALSMVVYALTRDALLAIGSAVLIFFTRAAETGTVYPIALAGTSHTYGVLGLSTFALVAGLLGAGCHRTAGFLLGLAPAVHPSLGVWLVVIVALATAWPLGAFRVTVRPMLGFFLAGSGVALISLAVQLVFMREVPSIEREVASRYLTAFVAFWDGHRQPASLGSQGVQLNAAAAVLAMIWLKWFTRDLPPPAILLLRIVVTTAAVSLALAFVSHVPAEDLPAIFVISMPGRLLNVSAMLFPALLLGLVGSYQQQRWGRGLFLFLAAALAVNNRSMLWSRVADSGWVREIVPVTRPVQVFAYGVAGLLFLVGASAWYRRGRNPSVPQASTLPVAHSSLIARGLLLGAPVVIAALMWPPPTAGRVIFEDWRNNAVLSQAAQGDGMLLTGGSLDLVQLRTRRAVLLNGGGLDGLPYAPESGPAVEEILREVYAIDFFNPPEAARGKGAIPGGHNLAEWKRFSPETWHRIRRAYGVTQVLTSADWDLPLPLVARDAAYALYQLP